MQRQSPRVTVPVLSRTRVSRVSTRSKAEKLRMSMPCGGEGHAGTRAREWRRPGRRQAITATVTAAARPHRFLLLSQTQTRCRGQHQYDGRIPADFLRPTFAGLRPACLDDGDHLPNVDSAPTRSHRS